MVGVNVGSGEYYADGWVNVDPWEAFSADVRASAVALPLGDGCADQVYFGHVLEHLTRDDEAVRSVHEAWRVLKPGGSVVFVGPDYDRAMAFRFMECASGPYGLIKRELELTAIRAHGDGYGAHQWTSTEASTLDLVRDVFPDVHPIPFDETRWPFWPNRVNGPNQFAILATKR